MLVAVRPGAGYRDGGAPSNTRLNANGLAGLRRAQAVTPTLLALTTGPRSRDALAWRQRRRPGGKRRARCLRLRPVAAAFDAAATAWTMKGMLREPGGDDRLGRGHSTGRASATAWRGTCSPPRPRPASRLTARPRTGDTSDACVPLRMEQSNPCVMIAVCGQTSGLHRGGGYSGARGPAVGARGARRER